MYYNLSLDKTEEYEDTTSSEENLEEEQTAQAKLICFCEDAIRLLNDEMMLDKYPVSVRKAYGSEGFFSSIYDFVSTIISTAVNAVSSVATWITKKIKSLISIRKHKKQYRDQQFNRFVSILNSISATDRAAVQNRLMSYSIQYMPSKDQYIQMCKGFSVLMRAITQQVDTYVAKDIHLFGMEKEAGQKAPSWILKLYEDPVSREMLLLFGIKYMDGTFQRQSVYNTMPSMTFGDLGYNSIQDIAVVHQAYNQHVWPQVRTLLVLRERFEAFERDLKEKKSQLSKAGASKIDKNACVASCKNVIISSKEASKLVAYLSLDEEALDTRRAWLVEHGLKACGTIMSDASRPS